MARCDSYVAGQCTKGACLAEGWIPDGLGNADQWLERAAARGFATTDVPTVNAAAVFKDAGRYNAVDGHCGLVMAVASYSRFKVLEMNFSARGVYDQRWTDRAGLLGFILPPGTAPGTGLSVLGPAPPAQHTLEAAWDDFAAMWNYVVDAEIVNLSNLYRAISGIG